MKRYPRIKRGILASVIGAMILSWPVCALAKTDAKETLPVQEEADEQDVTVQETDCIDPGEDIGFNGTPGKLEVYEPEEKTVLGNMMRRTIGRARGWDAGSLGLSGTVYARTYNEDGDTLSGVFGFEKLRLVEWMHEQASTGYYLGTAYDGGDNRNPNGDPSYNGRDVRPGQAGLNCTGFVWHMLMKSGARVTGESDGKNTSFTNNTAALQAAGANVDNSGTNPVVPGESGWVSFLAGSHVEYKTYISDSWDDMVKVLVADDYWDVGDLIWTWDLKNPLVSGAGGNNGKFPNADTAQRLFFTEGMYGHAASGLSWGNSAHNHVLLYCGDGFAQYSEAAANNYAQYVSGVSDQLVWHSSETHFNYQTWQPDDSSPWNQITSIFPKESAGPYAVTIVKTGESVGKVKLKKVSAGREVVRASGSYSLAGSVYGVYRTEADARNQTAQLAALTTDENGDTNEVELDVGTYYVKETIAPKGYTLDTNIHPVTVESGKTATVQSLEVPQELRIRLQKVDAETGRNTPQGTATLSGAVYEIYDSAGNKVDELTTDTNGAAISRELPLDDYTVRETKASTGYLVDGKSYTVKGSTPADATTQVFEYSVTSAEVPQKVQIRLKKKDAETGEGKPQGAASLAGAIYEIYDSAGSKVDELTTDTAGTALSRELPLGIYTVRETKASEGYLIDGQSHTVNANVPGDTVTRVFEYETESGEDVIRGNVEIIKLLENQEEDEDTMKGLSGVEFTFTSKTTGENVLTIVTDADGFATTALAERPRGTLVYDTYTVTETKYPQGVKPIEPFDVTISKERVTLKGIYKEDKLIVSPVTVIKRDAGTGRAIPIAGVEFRLLDENQKPITMTTRYPKEQVHETFQTDADGQFTFPEMLKCGTYYLEEVNAPEGYLKGELLEFQVEEGATWEHPLVVEYADENVMGKIRIEKVGAESASEAEPEVENTEESGIEKVEESNTQTREEGAPDGEEEFKNPVGDTEDGEKTEEEVADAKAELLLDGAIFEIMAAEDIVTPDGTVRALEGDVVDTVTTIDGVAESKSLFLGRYLVKEVTPPEGYVLSDRVYEVALEYQGQDTPVVECALKVENTPSRIQIYKIDKDTREALPGVEFEFWKKADNEEPAEDIEDGKASEEPEADDEGELEEEPEAGDEGESKEEPEADDKGESEEEPEAGDKGESEEEPRPEKQVLITDDKGMLEIVHLAPGVYCFQETKTLEGYLLDDAVHEVVVSGDGRINGEEIGILYVGNEKIPEEPQKPEEPKEEEPKEPRIPEEPDTPEEPEAPEEPDAPEEPEKPELPTEPEVPIEPEEPMEETPMPEEPEESQPEAPNPPAIKTGDAGEWMPYVVLMGTSMAILGWTLWHRRMERKRRRRRRKPHFKSPTASG